MRVEKRKNVRYLVQEKAFAAIGPTYAQVGRLRDISISGLSFEYISAETAEENNDHIDIFLTGKEFHLYNVPCQVVYNIDAYDPDVDRKYVKYLTTKRCGVAFEELSDKNLKQLEYFIKTYAVEPA